MTPCLIIQHDNLKDGILSNHDKGSNEVMCSLKLCLMSHLLAFLHDGTSAQPRTFKHHCHVIDGSSSYLLLAFREARGV